MYIAIFTDTFLPQVNGVVRSLVATVNELVARGHRVVVHTMQLNKIPSASSDPLATLDPRVQVHQYFSLAAPGFADVQCRVPNFTTPLTRLRGDRPDLIHSHTNFTMAWEARWAAQRLDLPLISTHHGLLAEYLRNFGLGFEPAKRWMRDHLARSYDRAAAVVAPSDALRTELLKHGCRAPIHVISNPVDSGLIRPPDGRTVRKTHSLDRPTVVHVGRLVPQKSVDRLLQAFAHTIYSGTEASLVIVGDGRERPKLEDLARKLKIANYVCWTGLLQGSTLVEQLTSSDVFASASTSETQGLVFLEAMALGLPCVGVNAGGVPQYVRHRKDGLIAAPDDVASFSAALSELLQDPELRRRLGDSGRAHARQFSAVHVVAQLEHLYREVLRGA